MFLFVHVCVLMGGFFFQNNAEWEGENTSMLAEVTLSYICIALIDKMGNKIRTYHNVGCNLRNRATNQGHPM